MTVLYRRLTAFQLDAARGEIDGLSPLYKFGHNAAVGVTPEDVWTIGGTYNFQTSASAVRAKAGGDANDTSGGTGARTVVVVGLDQNWSAASETITLAGGSASAATTTTFVRVFRAYVDTCGAYGGSNVGAVTIETTGGTTVAEILAGRGQTEMAVYSVAANHTLYLTALRLQVASTSKTAYGRLWWRPNADLTTAPCGPKRLLHRVESVSTSEYVQVTGHSWPGIPEKSDVWIDAAVDVGGAEVGASFDGFLVRNT